MLDTFGWAAFDVTWILPDGWQEEARLAADEAEVRPFGRTPVISREAADVQQVVRGRVHAEQVAARLPWLRELYRAAFRELAEQAAGRKVYAAADERYGSVLNVQRGPGMRFECHVDSNPLTGLLFCTDHGPGAGGELVFGRDKSARSVTGVERSCSVLRPQAGHLIFFDGREHPHYVRPLKANDDIRVVAVMNYYTDECPESTRPPELNRHLYGDQKNQQRFAVGAASLPEACSADSAANSYQRGS
jgi:2OG-Fe(II) oxygenase superfamily